MSGLRRHLFCCLVLLLQISPIAGADSTYLQPASVYLGDITELVIEYDNSIPSLYALDTSALAADFEIVDKKSRILRMTESDEVFHRMQWRLHLLPRRSGSLSVPPLYFGDNSTRPLTLEVAPVPASLQSSQRVFVEMVADSRTPYVGQQTQIGMRLYRNTPVTDGQLLEPKIHNALIHRHLVEQSYSVARDSQEFTVTERGIALFPQSAGELRLPPVSYRGSINLPTGKSQAPAIRHIMRRSNPLSLQVRNPPAEFSGRFWLPASRLEIFQSWTETDKALQVGDSMDWTLTIIAHGLPAESLPADLRAMESKNFRIYADQPTRGNRFDGRQMIGRLDQRFAVIASQPGEIVLPTLSLKWWDVVSDSEKRVRLEGRAIEVIDAIVPGDSRTAVDRNNIASWWMKRDSRQWSGPRILLSMLLLVVFLIAIKLLPSRITAMLKPVLLRRSLLQRLKRACLSNDATATRVALVEWGRGRWPEKIISGLNQIDRQIASSELNARLKELDAALYSRHDGGWSGQALWRQLEALKPPVRTIPQDKDLPRLYPVRYAG